MNPVTMEASRNQGMERGQPPYTNLVVVMPTWKSSAVHAAAASTPRNDDLVRKTATVNAGKAARLIAQITAAQIPVKSHHIRLSTCAPAIKLTESRPSLTAPRASATIAVATRIPAMESRGDFSEAPCRSFEIRQQNRLRKIQSGIWHAQKRIGTISVNGRFR